MTTSTTIERVMTGFALADCTVTEKPKGPSQ